MNMELAASPRLVYYPTSSPLLKSKVRISQRPLASTLTSFAQRPIFSLNHGLLLRMSEDPHRVISCPASLEENVSTINARIGEVKRVTKETNVLVKINLDGSGIAENNTGIPFLDHMLDVSDLSFKNCFDFTDFFFFILQSWFSCTQLWFPISVFYERCWLFFFGCC